MSGYRWVESRYQQIPDKDKDIIIQSTVILWNICLSRNHLAWSNIQVQPQELIQQPQIMHNAIISSMCKLDPQIQKMTVQLEERVDPNGNARSHITIIINESFKQQSKKAAIGLVFVNSEDNRILQWAKSVFRHEHRFGQKP